MLNSASAIGVPEVVSAVDMIKGNVKINTVYVSYIFNTKHGLEELTAEEAEEYEQTKLLYDDIEGTKEERAFRFWINSLDIEGVFVNNLYEEARDGLILLKVI